MWRNFRICFAYYSCGKTSARSPLLCCSSSRPFFAFPEEQRPAASARNKLLSSPTEVLGSVGIWSGCGLLSSWPEGGAARQALFSPKHLSSPPHRRPTSPHTAQNTSQHPAQSPSHSPSQLRPIRASACPSASPLPCHLPPRPVVAVRRTPPVRPSSTTPGPGAHARGRRRSASASARGSRPAPAPPFRPPVARPRGAGAPRAALGRALSERGGCGACIERRWPSLPPPGACGCGACAAPSRRIPPSPRSGATVH